MKLHRKKIGTEKL